MQHKHDWILLLFGPFEQEESAGNVDSELATVISSIAVACKQIASLVSGTCGVAGPSENLKPLGVRTEHRSSRLHVPAEDSPQQSVATGRPPFAPAPCKSCTTLTQAPDPSAPSDTIGGTNKANRCPHARR